MAKTIILVDIFYLHVAQTGIKTYIECLCEEINRDTSSEFTYIITPRLEKIQKSKFFKGKTPLWKNLLYQSIYFFRKLLIIPLLSIKHRSSIIFSPDILSPIWARGTKISVIHDAFFWENPKHYNPLWLRVYLFLLEAGLKKNAQVITISEYSKLQIEKYLRLPNLQFHVVYPSSNLRLSGKGVKQNPPLKDPYFLHVGVMEKRKNLPVLIQAFSQMVKREDFARFKLVLVGQRGPRKTLDDYDHVLDLITSLELENRVILPGFLNSRDLNNYYQHALAYVFPSLNEGFGMPILEAFSFGLPVIISNQGSMVEVGGDAVLIVKENSPKGFEEALIQVGGNVELRQKLIARGRERLNKFSSPNFFLSLQDCFRRVPHE